MLKKYTDFTNNKVKVETKTESINTIKNIKCNKNIKSVQQNISQKIQKSKIQESKIQESKIQESKIQESNLKNFNFIGKTVNFSTNIKPSKSIIILENNNISKNKLHYIISKQSQDSLIIFKYNEKIELKLTDFINTLINYHKKNDNSKNIFENIVIDGNNNFSIIKNIPNINLLNTLNNEIIKLLK
jgi:hypothetical protein